MTTQQLYTRERLAAELGRDRRFISKVLAKIPPDGRCGRYPAWRLTTVLPLLDGRERLAPPDMQKLGAAAQRAADDLQDGFDRLKREPSISVRRNNLMRKVGPLVGRFFRALDATAVGESAAERVCNHILRNHMKGWRSPNLRICCRRDFARTDHSLKLVNSIMALPGMSDDRPISVAERIWWLCPLKLSEPRPLEIAAIL